MEKLILYLSIYLLYQGYKYYAKQQLKKREVTNNPKDVETSQTQETESWIERELKNLSPKQKPTFDDEAKPTLPTLSTNSKNSIDKQTFTNTKLQPVKQKPLVTENDASTDTLYNHYVIDDLQEAQEHDWSQNQFEKTLIGEETSTQNNLFDTPEKLRNAIIYEAIMERKF